MKIILIFSLALLFGGCFNDEPSSQQKTPPTQKQTLETIKMSVENEKLIQMKIEALRERDMAEINMKKELASIDREKEYELAKLDSKLQMQRLLLEKELALEQFKQNNLIRESEQAVSQQRYLLFYATVIIILLAGALYYFMKRRRDDKLRAYNDNLEKYFQNKQNESRVKIAEKIIDTIATGKLNSQQEAQLIQAINSENRHHADVDVDDADIIEQLPDKSG